MVEVIMFLDLFNNEYMAMNFDVTLVNLFK